MAPTTRPFDVLYEDNHLLVVAKAAQLPTMGVRDGRDTLLSLAKAYIGRKYHKPGNVYLGIVSRLDAPVTGIMVLARTSKAAARLTEQYRSHTVQKIYWAVVEGRIRPGQQRLVASLRKDERHRRMHVTTAAAPGARQAVLRYRTLRLLDHESLLEVQLETGRKHQIRVQLAHLGHPVVGDRKYGSRRPFQAGIALHSRSIRLEHPVRKVPLQWTAPLPGSWRTLGVVDPDDA